MRVFIVLTLALVSAAPGLFADAASKDAKIEQFLTLIKANSIQDQIYTQLNQIASKVNAAVDKINAGQGTIGQLMVNPALYDSLNGTAREVQSLIKDMHANPKKFLTIKLVLF